MIYAVADPGTNQVTIANAGHLPPVIIRADGHTEILANHEELLLGAGTAPRSVGVFDLFPGDALLAFTDGLVERPDEDIDDSQARLLHACEALHSRSITEALDVLVEHVTDPNRDDDVAAIHVRRLS
jgi:serine phosphatase RsbU (regulator of sigma subunit)